MKKVRWLNLDQFLYEKCTLINFRSILVWKKYEDKTKKMKIDLDRFKIDLNWS